MWTGRLFAAVATKHIYLNRKTREKELKAVTGKKGGGEKYFSIQTPDTETEFTGRVFPGRLRGGISRYKKYEIFSSVGS